MRAISPYTILMVRASQKQDGLNSYARNISQVHSQSLSLSLFLFQFTRSRGLNCVVTGPRVVIGHPIDSTMVPRLWDTLDDPFRNFVALVCIACINDAINSLFRVCLFSFSLPISLVFIPELINLFIIKLFQVFSTGESIISLFFRKFFETFLTCRIS